MSDISMGPKAINFSILYQVLIFIPMIIIGDLYVILNNLGFLNRLTEVLVTYGYIWHRIKHPEINRPFKVIKGLFKGLRQAL